MHLPIPSFPPVGLTTPAASYYTCGPHYTCCAWPLPVQARTSATRLLVRLGQMEQQLSGSSAVRRALDVSLASWHDVGLGRQSAASTSSTGRAHKCAGQLQPQPQQQQASQQQQRHVLRSGASAPRARSWSVMDRARAVRLCMQQGSYLPQDERAYSVVLSANEKQQVLEEYRCGGGLAPYVLCTCAP